MASPISSVLAVPPRSAVTQTPSRRTSRQAFEMAWEASRASWSSFFFFFHSSIMRADSIMAKGLAICRPAMSGAEPWVAWAMQ